MLSPQELQEVLAHGQGGLSSRECGLPVCVCWGGGVLRLVARVHTSLLELLSPRELRQFWRTVRDSKHFGAGASMVGSHVVLEAVATVYTLWQPYGLVKWFYGEFQLDLKLALFFAAL